jgi:hypothetical protein
MQSKQRTVARKLATGRVNARFQSELRISGKQIQTVLWDRSVDGGAVGTYSFGVSLPAGAVVTNIYSDEQTAVTGADEIQLKAGSTDLSDVIDFTATSGANSRALASSATAIKLSSASELKMAVTTNAATAGKIRWCVEFYVSPS